MHSFSGGRVGSHLREIHFVIQRISIMRYGMNSFKKRLQMTYIVCHLILHMEGPASEWGLGHLANIDLMNAAAYV